MNKNYIKTNPIFINVTFIISIVLSIVATYIINMCLSGYLDINVNTITCIITFLPIMILGGSLIEFKNTKQALLSILPTPTILLVLMLIHCFTNFSNNNFVLSIPYDAFRFAFFHPVESTLEYWQSMLIPQILVIIIVTISFVFIPSKRFLKKAE